jgi:hypothetical protein
MKGAKVLYNFVRWGKRSNAFASLGWFSAQGYFRK